MPAAPSGAAELTGPFRTRKAFYDRDEVPDDAVHGEGAQLTFTLTFDEAVTVEGGRQSGAGARCLEAGPPGGG